MTIVDAEALTCPDCGAAFQRHEPAAAIRLRQIDEWICPVCGGLWYRTDYGMMIEVD